MFGFQEVDSYFDSKNRGAGNIGNLSNRNNEPFLIEVKNKNGVTDVINNANDSNKKTKKIGILQFCVKFKINRWAEKYGT